MEQSSSRRRELETKGELNISSLSLVIFLYLNLAEMFFVSSYAYALRKITGEQPRIMGRRSVVSEEQIKLSRAENTSHDKTITEMLKKTRRWGRGRRHQSEIRVVNKFGPVAPFFFYPLVQGFLESKTRDELWNGDNGAALISCLLITLSSFVDNSGAHPGTGILAKDLFELCWSFHNAENSEVRIAVLVALATCFCHLPMEALVQMCYADEVPRFLENTKVEDSDERCRRLASQLIKFTGLGQPNQIMDLYK